MTTALLVDDEPQLLLYLKRKLASVWPELDVVGTAANGREALALAADLQPDIAFLDIQMPGLSGLQVAETLVPETRVVFVTAHDEYAVAAFEKAAVDYLLKPIDEDRLRVAVERLKAATQPADVDRLADVIRRLSHETSDDSLRWLRSTRDGATQLVPVDTVVFFQAAAKYTSAFTDHEEHLIRTSIRELESQLDRNEFWQVNRGTIVRVEEIAEARRDLRGRYVLTLKQRPEQITTSPRYGHLFKGM